jgi:hypothetical protein
MAFIFRITEDYETDSDPDFYFFDKLDDWLQREIPFYVRETAGAHYGYQFLGESYQAQWKVLERLFLGKYQAMFEQHFGFEVPINRVAEFEHVHTDDWSIFRVRFCLEPEKYGVPVPTNDYYFYLVEVKGDEHDQYMIRFKLTEM